MRTFETFLLEAANRAPFLVGEAAPVLVRRQQKRARESDKETAEGETRQLPQEEDIVRLQRLLVDGPLQPLGLEHAVYHFLLPAFTAAMDAAREVWRTAEALRAAEKATKAKEGDGAMKKESEESAGANSDPIGTTTGAETSTQPQPNVEALQRALIAAQATLNAQRQLLDAAEAKLRTIVEAVMCAFAKPKMSPRDEEAESRLIRIRAKEHSAYDKVHIKAGVSIKMQVFGARMASRGGRTLPLTYFMQSELTTAEEAPPVDVFTAKLGNRTFHESLRNDSGFAIVTAFLLGGVDINVRDKNGATPLHIAVSRAAPTPGNDDDESVFLSSEGPNNLIISFLIDNGADINSRNATGETPLMIAAATQNISALRIILSRGADTSLRDDIGNTVLHHAACHPHVLQTLHSWIDDLPAQAARENLLHMVCRQGRGAEFAALFLIEQLGVDVNAREGETAATTGVHDGDHHYRPIEANTATAAAAAIQRCDSAPHSGVIVKEGLTPLHCAVLVGDTLLLRSLLLKGADVEKPDATGRTPIQLAKDCAMSSSPSLLTSLLSFIRFQCSFLGLTQRNGRTAKNIDPWKVYTILDAHCKEASSAKREANLQREAAADTSLWRLNTISDILSFGAAAALPHFLMALCALMGMPLWILIVFATIELILCNGFKVEDERRLNVRPLRCVGFLVGYTLVLLACSISLEDAMEPRRMNTRPWLFLCTIGSALCAFLVMWMNPGIVESTAGQRVGIYKTIFYSKGAPPEDVRQGIDLSCMVKKPLRAQRCRHLGRVVLRYDHYCTWLASAIGGGNHRLYIAFLLFYTVLLGICCRGTYWLSPNQMNNEMFFDDLHFRRFANVYILFVLPVAFIFSLYTLLQQLWYIARGVTAYDVAQPSCCPWCFQLGSRTYSLFDAGFWRNVCGFFFLREKFLNISYRMPVMSVRLQKMAKRHQALQLSSCHDGHCHSHENGGHGHSHNGHLGQLHQYNPQQRSNAPLNTALSNVAEGIDSPATTAVVINSSTPASALASDPFPSVAVDTTAAATQLGFEASVGRLFQLMVQHGDTDLTAVAAANEIRASVLPEKWQEIVEMAQSMYGFFKSTMNNANN